jgi:hypothetical protein
VALAEQHIDEQARVFRGIPHAGQPEHFQRPFVHGLTRQDGGQGPVALDNEADFSPVQMLALLHGATYGLLRGSRKGTARGQRCVQQVLQQA